MAAGKMVKQFLIDTTKTAGQTQDVTDAAILGQPVAVLFFATGQVGSHTAGGNGHANRLIGWAAATTEGGGLKNLGLIARSENANATVAKENGYVDNANVISTLTAGFGGAIDGRVAVTSMLSNGFRLTYTEQFSLALSVMAVVLWGSDFTNLEMLSFASPTSGTTPFTEDHTLPFACSDKNAVVFMMGSRETDVNTQVNDSDISFGAAASAAEQVCFCGAGDDALALPTPGTECRRHADASQSFVLFGGNKSSLSHRLAFNSWLGAGGLRVMWNAVSGAAAALVHCLVIKGGQWSVKTGTAPASGTVDVTGAGFNPLGALVLSHGAALDSSATAHSPDIQESWGAFDAARNASYAVRNLTNQTASTLVATLVAPTTCYSEITTAGAVNAAMSGAPITDGVRLTVQTGNPSGHQFAVVMVGQSPVGGGGTGRPVPDRIVAPKQRLQRSKRW